MLRRSIQNREKRANNRLPKLDFRPLHGEQRFRRRPGKPCAPQAAELLCPIWMNHPILHEVLGHMKVHDFTDDVVGGIGSGSVGDDLVQAAFQAERSFCDAVGFDDHGRHGSEPTAGPFAFPMGQGKRRLIYAFSHVVTDNVDDVFSSLPDVAQRVLFRTIGFRAGRENDGWRICSSGVEERKRREVGFPVCREGGNKRNGPGRDGGDQ